MDKEFPPDKSRGEQTHQKRILLILQYTNHKLNQK
jgi:hypothetical protein